MLVHWMKPLQCLCMGKWQAKGEEWIFQLFLFFLLKIGNLFKFCSPLEKAIFRGIVFKEKI
jgi:hypothetical protein